MHLQPKRHLSTFLLSVLQIKKESDARQRHLNSCLDAQEQYGSRLSDARFWQSTAQKELTKLESEKPPSVRISDLESKVNRLKVLEGQQFAHKGDIKALSSSAQKFLNTVLAIEDSQTAFAQRQGHQLPVTNGEQVGCVKFNVGQTRFVNLSKYLSSLHVYLLQSIDCRSCSLPLLGLWECSSRVPSAGSDPTGG